MVIGMGGLFSCNSFLQKPDTTGVIDLDEVYSSTENAMRAVMTCYRTSLQHGLGGGWGVGHGVLANISGERARGYSWHGTYMIANTGLSVQGSDGSPAGADHYTNGWAYIRACYLVIENIDRVPDMDQKKKDEIKSEMYGLIAYRYMGMFYRYGGVPKVEKAFSPSDDLSAPRMTLQETLDFIVELCGKALADLPSGDRPGAEMGRLNRGSVLAIEARAKLFAARKLFNSATPYLDLGENNDMICFGNSDPQRWQAAITANEAVLTWAASAGYYLIKTGSGVVNTFQEAAADYGNATSRPANRETLLAYKCNSTSQTGWSMGVFKYICTTPNGSWNGERYDTDESGLLTNTLEKYYRRDGSDQSWPKIGDAPRPATDYIDRLNNAEARLLVDNLFPGIEDHIGNPGNTNYQASRQGKPLLNGDVADRYPGVYSVGHGPRAVKFYYGAEGRTWTELPLFRLAETYLNLAEAYNEAGNAAKALENLNKVHNRAGLSSITETDKDNLRKIIQRERAIELCGENHRYFDAKHWMIEDIDEGGLCGPMREFQIKAKQTPIENIGSRLDNYWDAVTYNAFWADYMYLEPFPQSEVNKGFLVQNPGY